MMNDRRRPWTTILCIGLLAPFLALLALSCFTSNPCAAAGPATSMPATSVGGRTVAAAGPAVAGVADVPLLAAGDGRELWVMVPAVGENRERGFQLLRRSANTGVWRAALHGGAGGGGGGQPFWSAPTMPRALALMQTPADHPGASSPYLLGEPQANTPGWVYRCSLDDYQRPDVLPPGHIIKAATGGVNQLFVITLGPPVAVATQPGTGTASVPASAAASASVVPLQFNAYWFPPTASATATYPANALLPKNGEWNMLTPLGQPSDDPTAVPKSSSHMALAEQNGRLLVFWADPLHPAVIVLRSLDYASRQQQWSAPQALRLGEEVPAESRLFTVALDKTLYLLWTVPTGSSRALHGGWINVDGKSEPALHAISAMPLDAAGTGLTVNDVAVGPSENSLVVLVNNHDEGLKEMVFDSRGNSRTKAQSVAPQGPRRDMLIGQNIAMVLLVLMMTLSLWQWRQKPAAIALPAGTVIAPLHLRAGAFLADIILPYAAVLIISGNWDSGYFAMFFSWIGLLSNPEELVKATDLFMFLGIYVGHVMLGELFFRRSLGKALVGLQVLMMDGKAPTVAAILVRNLVRVPECAVGVVLLYLVMSDRRQRLGDLLARTLVVAQQPPEVPEDVDKKSEK